MYINQDDVFFDYIAYIGRIIFLSLGRTKLLFLHEGIISSPIQFRPARQIETSGHRISA